MTSPWISAEPGNFTTEDSLKTCDSFVEGKEQLKFEDNFQAKEPDHHLPEQKLLNSAGRQPLPDSEIYLKSLEIKLAKIKKQTGIVEALAEKREDCMRALLEGNSTQNCFSDTPDNFIYDTPISRTDILRQLQPVQPLTVGETVHIVEHDQLEQQRKEAELSGEQPKTEENN